MSGIASISADRSAMFPHLMPLFTTVLGVVFLGEAPRPYHALGMV